jgi:ABC-2 type transport system permease protein
MSDAPASSNIYDLGYRRYDGLRLGRRHSVTALYFHSFKAAFGIGRPATAKIIPMSLAVITLLPALIQLGIAAVASNIELYSASGYYGYVQWILALFVAGQAPELVGRDQRYRTLTLYFSRSLQRSDYAVAKVAALTSALLVLTLTPQVVLFLGRAFAGNDFWGYVQDNWQDIPPIIGSGLLLSLFMASLAIAIASYTKRRAFATGGILAYFAIATTVSSILVQTASGTLQKFVLLLSGFHIIRGFTLWMFDVTPTLDAQGNSNGPGGDLVLAGLDLYWYAVFAVVVIVAMLFIVYRRYQKVSA